jgi:outer membrane lipoprotein-sorting protein
MFQHHRALRWLAPVGVLGVVGLAAGGMITAKASTSDPLPGTTTAELIADMHSTSVPGFSGTVVAQMSLGLPQLPATTDEHGGSSLAGLLAGSHTMRVWYGSVDHQRIALLGQTSETDVFHSGQDIWEWDSDTREATHTVLPAHSAGTHPTATAPTTAESLTPQQLATQLLASISPTTKVTLGAKRTIADRSAYDLVLTPRDATRVGSVHIAIDGATKVPLSVQVFARGASSAAVDVAFSDISFKTPPAGYFGFTPPAGATVHVNSPTSAARDSTGSSSADANPIKTFGSGWSSVVEYHATAAEVKKTTGGALSALTPVSGAWGSGHLLDAALFSALVTDDGRLFAGAVDPQALFAAASTH